MNRSRCSGSEEHLDRKATDGGRLEKVKWISQEAHRDVSKRLAPVAGDGSRDRCRYFAQPDRRIGSDGPESVLDESRLETTVVVPVTTLAQQDIGALELERSIAEPPVAEPLELDFAAPQSDITEMPDSALSAVPEDRYCTEGEREAARAATKDAYKGVFHAHVVET